MENKAGRLQEMSERHPLEKKITAGKTEEILQERRNTADEIAGLRAELSNYPMPDEGTRELRAELARMETQIQQLREQITMKRTEISQERLQIENRIKALESVLWDSSDARIDEGIAFFQAEHEKLLRQTVSVTKGTNYPAVVAAMSYCRQSIAELMAMKFQVEPDFEKIENLKRFLPPMDEPAAFAGTTFIPESKGSSPGPQMSFTEDYPVYSFRKDDYPAYPLREDDYLASQLKKVNEKFKKWKLKTFQK